MSALLRLYPSAWRARYEDEVTELLAERPPSLGDTLDLVRGALDAHLHRAMVPAAVGPDGSMAVPPVRPDVRRRVPMAAFLGTLAGGLFIVTAGSLVVQPAIPHVAVQLTSTLLAIATFVLGLTVLATTGRGLIAKLAGLAFVGGLVFLLWTDAYMPAYLSIVSGSSLLLLGSVVERQPLRAIGVLAGGLALALWISYEADAYLMEAVMGGYAVVALALARTVGGSARPMAVGIAATVAVVGIIWAVTSMSSPRVLHTGYPVRCGDLGQAECFARIDDLAARFHELRPSDVVTDGTIDETGAAQICATIVTSGGGRNPFDDPELSARIEGDAMPAMRLIGGHGSGDSMTATCWQATGITGG